MNRNRNHNKKEKSLLPLPDLEKPNRKSVAKETSVCSVPIHKAEFIKVGLELRENQHGEYQWPSSKYLHEEDFFGCKQQKMTLANLKKKET